MRRIALISCVSQKLQSKAKPQDLYTSTLFKYNMKYARMLNPDKIFILSAKYGLVKLDDEIDTYDDTLNTKTTKEIKEWSNRVLEALRKEADLDSDEMIFLAGERYRRFLIPKIKNYKIPMKGLGIGRQLQFLKEATK